LRGLGCLGWHRPLQEFAGPAGVRTISLGPSRQSGIVGAPLAPAPLSKWAIPEYRTQNRAGLIETPKPPGCNTKIPKKKSRKRAGLDRVSQRYSLPRRLYLQVPSVPLIQETPTRVPGGSRNGGSGDPPAFVVEVEELCGHEFSASTISRVTEQLDEELKEIRAATAGGRLPVSGGGRAL
jgi:hypothetical protein